MHTLTSRFLKTLLLHALISLPPLCSLTLSTLPLPTRSSDLTHCNHCFCALSQRSLAQRPPSTDIVDGPLTVRVVPAPEVPFNMTLPSVVASAWVADRGGTLGLMMSNLCDSPLTVTATLNLSRTELCAPLGESGACAVPLPLTAHRLTFVALSKPLAVAQLPDVALPFWSRTERLASGEAVFIQLGALL